MDDVEHMRRALAQAATVRSTTAPNPWVGCVIVPPGPAADAGAVFAGATAPPGGPHAEAAALAAAGEAARGATLYVTLEPCAHHGRTPPCTDAIIEAGVARVVVGIEDPDTGSPAAASPRCGRPASRSPWAWRPTRSPSSWLPTCKHRTTGQPWVVLKMAASLDGRTAAPDGTSRWITGEAARRDVHRLRARSDAVLVGAGTVRADDPALTVRLDDGVEREQPLRVVLGKAPADAKVQPALELAGDLGDVLTELGRRGVLQLLVEGGASVAHDFHAAAWSTATSCTSRPCFSGATTAARFSRAPGLAQLVTCGRAGWCR